MTTTSSVDAVARPVTDGGCAACPHPLDVHDPISLRFCRASEAQATTTRGCVCPTR